MIIESLEVGGSVPKSVLISIVTVTFNDDEGLSRTFESLVRLGGLPYEVIVVDGASLASTQRLVTSLVPAATLIQEPDHGPYDAMNKGALRARGKWLWFLNAGDSIAPHVTPEMIEGLVAAARNSLVVARSLNTSGAPWPSDGSASLAGYLSPCHQAMLTPRHLLSVPLFDSRLQIAADYDAFLTMSARGSVYFADAAICVYEGGGVSSRRRLRLEAELLWIRLRHGLQLSRRLPGDLLRIPWRALRGWHVSRREAR